MLLGLLVAFHWLTIFNYFPQIEEEEEDDTPPAVSTADAATDITTQVIDSL